MWYKTFSIVLFASASEALLVPSLHALPRRPLPPLVAALNIKEAAFEQLIDHNNPSLGTFTQRYWWNADHYAGPGSPIILNAPGENNADGYQAYTTNTTLPGLFAQTNSGAAILLEHRYYGGSSPYEDLTAATLQHLNLHNSIQDLVYFANNARLPFDPSGSSRPDKAPWVLSGCAYSGALAAWTMALAPNTFWAYHCSSAAVQHTSVLAQRYDPIEHAMPGNCSADFKQVMQHIDHTLSNESTERRQALKGLFGLGGLQHDDDFAAALVGGLQGWQRTQLSSDDTSLHQLCNYMENQTGNSDAAPGLQSIGLTRALDGYARWTREVMIPGACAGRGYWWDRNTIDCWDSYSGLDPAYGDISVHNRADRQWMWLLCNEPYAFWRVLGSDFAADFTSRSFYRRHRLRQCGRYFPDADDFAYSLNASATASEVHAENEGRHLVKTTRLMWVNGEYDPWRPAAVSTDLSLAATRDVPAWVIAKGTHCNDILLQNGQNNPEVRGVVEAEVKKMRQWVGEFYQMPGRQRRQ